MKKTLLLCTLLISTVMYGQHMYSWRALPACGDVNQVAISPSHVYAVGGEALVVVEKESEEVSLYTKLNGLHGANVAQIAYVDAVHALVVAYTDGMIDYITHDAIIAQNDLCIKSMNSSKRANCMFVQGNKIYMGMPFGILVVNASKHEITDTYYIGDNGSDVNVQSVVVTEDSIYATDENILYVAPLHANLLDYLHWRREPLTKGMQYAGLGVYQDTALYSLIGQQLYRREAGTWQIVAEDHSFERIMNDGKDLYVADGGSGCYLVREKGLDYYSTPGTVYDVHKDGNGFWYALYDKGVLHYSDGQFQAFRPDGPAVNIPYRTKIFNDKLYVVPGARWATEENRPANIMIYDIQADTWHNITANDIAAQSGASIADLMNVAVDPNDEDHFFVTCYGTGLLEVQNYQIIHWYNMYNSPILSAAPGTYELHYMRTDGALYDDEDNLWFVNVEVKNTIHVITPRDIIAPTEPVQQATWASFPIVDVSGQEIKTHTPGEMFIDCRNSHWKWLPHLRDVPGLFLIDDNGTPTKGTDDRTVFRGSFTDQNGNVVSPEAIYAVAQEKDGRLWISLHEGLITIPAEVDFTRSDACERIIIPRNDGTDLADYLLNTERINAIAIDGANRKWFGTQNSGIFLISEDGIETLEHFTTDNSALPSNTILSISIDPKTGLVFIGTADGLMAYQSDAAEAEKNLLHAYAYPNPVRRDYTGIITISGLMDNTVLHIVDPAGNTVYETTSNGGIAVWDGHNRQGQRVASGIYSVLCNTGDGQHHCVTKIMIMH